MNNINSAINAHNNAILKPKPKNNSQDRTCNCRIKAQCPLNNNCLKSSLIYQATVTTDNGHKSTYVGLTENSFKTRYTNHKASFNHSSKRNSTELSKLIWNLKDSNIKYRINWTILKHATAYNPRTGKCNLCNWEQYFIIFRPDKSSINKRNELISACRHASKHLISNAIT